MNLQFIGAAASWNDDEVVRLVRSNTISEEDMNRALIFSSDNGHLQVVKYLF